jgi:hypothetical protein
MEAAPALPGGLGGVTGNAALDIDARLTSHESRGGGYLRSTAPAC